MFRELDLFESQGPGVWPPERAAGYAIHPEAMTARPTVTGQHHVLIRRNDTTGKLAYHRCYAPRPVPLQTLVTVAAQRWRIEESFHAAKELPGLDQHHVRRWTSWHRWTTLAISPKPSSP